MTDGKWCPRCGAEYIEGWGRCSECDVELVSEPPAPKVRPPRQAHPSSHGPADDDLEDPFVPIWEGPTIEGQIFLRMLQEANVPVDSGDPPGVGMMRVEVPRSYVTDAYEVLERANPDDVRAAESRLAEPEPDFDTEHGWDLWKRVFIGLVAAVLILLLILSTRS